MHYDEPQKVYIDFGILWRRLQNRKYTQVDERLVAWPGGSNLTETETERSLGQFKFINRSYSEAGTYEAGNCKPGVVLETYAFIYQAGRRREGIEHEEILFG